ncbi:MAG: hypothetical protein H6815_09150 [Phycisphaeraceae bacterium]|nr:hypothetical protein [Phycisphaerales bacterium]MCB9860604.1 hypothetical protein [Phycisphaeraceae bacterium]
MDVPSYSHQPHSFAGKRSDAVVTGASAGLVALAVVLAAPVVVSCLEAFTVAVPDIAGQEGAGFVNPRVFSGFVSSLPTLVLIAFLSALLATPASRLLAAKPGLILVALLPMLVLPSYLAYAALDQLREPGSWLGNIVLHAKAPAWSDDPGYWPVFASKVQAVFGLALWSWPIACALQTFARMQIGQSVFDALAMERLRRVDRSLLRLRIELPGFLLSAAAVLLVILGSAVPLHLANVPTQTQQIWLALQSGGSVQAWRSSIALLTVTLAAAIVVVVFVQRSTSSTWDLRAMSRYFKRPWERHVFLLMIALLAVVSAVPVFSMVYRYIRATHHFDHVVPNAMNDLARPALTSFIIGLVSAGVVVLIFVLCAVVSLRAESRLRVIVLGALTLLVWTSCVPGVLVGAGVGQQWGRFAAAMGYPGWMDQAQIVLAHIGRFGAVGALAGWIGGLRTSREERESLMLDSAGLSVRWVPLWLGSRIGSVIVVFLVVLTLSFHEIESAVMLTAPGLSSYPSQMLQLLHVFKWETLSVGVLLATLGSIVLVLVGICLVRARPIRRRL